MSEIDRHSGRLPAISERIANVEGRAKEVERFDDVGNRIDGIVAEQV